VVIQPTFRKRQTTQFDAMIVTDAAAQLHVEADAKTED
jgi:hypothetical protein